MLLLNCSEFFIYNSLADPVGAHPARAPPPNGRGPMIFYAQNANFSQFFRRSLRSRFILSMAKTR